MKNSRKKAPSSCVPVYYNKDNSTPKNIPDWTNLLSVLFTLLSDFYLTPQKENDISLDMDILS